MTKLQKLTLSPQPFKFDLLQAMNIIFEIQRQIAGQENIIATGIKSCIASGTPAKQIIKELKDMSQANYDTMYFMLGAPLTNSIINF